MTSKDEGLDAFVERILDEIGTGVLDREIEGNTIRAALEEYTQSLREDRDYWEAEARKLNLSCQEAQSRAYKAEAALAAQPAREDRAAIIEECAKVAAEYTDPMDGPYSTLDTRIVAGDIADAIRALAQGKP